MEDQNWQRLDKFLWHARVMKSRGDCAGLVQQGRIRINRQLTDKPHTKLRVGDVLSFVLRDEIKVWRIVKLAQRRGPATEARTLYDEIPDPASCADPASPAYPSQNFSPPGDQQ